MDRSHPVGSPCDDVDALKACARRLRQALKSDGVEISHSRSLELIARQAGARDWNTLSARARGPRSPVAITTGRPVRGRYLGQPFTGTVIGVADLGNTGRRRITIAFDQPVDVVAFASFSAFRRRIRAVVDPDGRSPQKTSDGRPHLVLEG